MTRSRPPQVLAALVLFVFCYWYFFSGRDELSSYTPEEINSLLQNKNEDVLSVKKTELTAQKLRKPYLDSSSSFSLADWDAAGKTVIKRDEYVRLISDSQHQAGSIFAKQPLSAESFEMELTFHLHSKSGSQLHGDGMALWFVDKKLPIGDVFGCTNYFNGLGIFLDTYKNGKRGHFPIVNLMLGDGKSRYNKNTDGFETRLASCNANSQLINPRSGETKIRVVYIKNGYLSIDLNYSGKHEDWNNCVTLTDVILPEVKYLGVSAESGQLTHAVDVLENRIYSLNNPDGSFVQSIEQLQNLISVKETPEEDIGRKSKGNHKKNQRKRKSLQRLKKSEERIKQKDRQFRLEKYGDEDATFVRRWAWRFLTAAKLTVLVIIAVLLVWFVFIVVRVQRQKRRTRTTGLLD